MLSSTTERGSIGVLGRERHPLGAEGSASRVAMGPLPKTGEWVRLEVEAAKVGLNPGAQLNGWAFTQHDGTCFWDRRASSPRTPQDGKSFNSLLAWEAMRRSRRRATCRAREGSLMVELAKRNDQQKRDQGLLPGDVYPATKPTFDKLNKEGRTSRSRRKDYDAGDSGLDGDGRMPKPRDTHILIRGQYDKKGGQECR